MVVGDGGHKKCGHRHLNYGALLVGLDHGDHLCLAADNAVVLNFASDNGRSVRPLPAPSVLRHPRQPPGRSSSLRCGRCAWTLAAGAAHPKHAGNGQKAATRPTGCLFLAGGVEVGKITVVLTVFVCGVGTQFALVYRSKATRSNASTCSITTRSAKP
jgi:hypothetical protein